MLMWKLQHSDCYGQRVCMNVFVFPMGTYNTAVVYVVYMYFVWSMFTVVMLKRADSFLPKKWSSHMLFWSNLRLSISTSILLNTFFSENKSIYHVLIFTYLKFIYSEKATKFSEISTVDLSFVVLVKSIVEISQNFVAFSEYMNFTIVVHYWVQNRLLFYSGLIVLLVLHKVIDFLQKH